MKRPNYEPLFPKNSAMKNLLVLITTSRGWLIRQAAKLAGAAGVWIAAKAQAAGAESVTEESASAAAALIAVGVIEVGFSFLARKNP
jgi:hypothetical protein